MILSLHENSVSALINPIYHSTNGLKPRTDDHVFLDKEPCSKAGISGGTTGVQTVRRTRAHGPRGPIQAPKLLTDCTGRHNTINNYYRQTASFY